VPPAIVLDFKELIPISTSVVDNYFTTPAYVPAGRMVLHPIIGQTLIKKGSRLRWVPYLRCIINWFYL